MKKIILIVSLLIMIGCSRPEHATKVLQSAGYTNIVITGFDFFACSDSDKFSTGFTAISPNGVAVKGTVCSGFFKGATIRFDQ